MWNIIKRILNSIINGLLDAILAGILIIGACILCIVVLDEDNWLFTLSLIIIAFFSSIYHYKNNK